MVNTDDFIKRLEIVLDYYSLNASSFADKIGVQRSSLSHLLSGRNKPSLDFILKIIEVFPDVDLYWILNGVGTFPRSRLETITKESLLENEIKQPLTPLSQKEIIPENLFSGIPIPNTVTTSEKRNVEDQNSGKENNSDQIDKIVIFYKNGTFKSYTPS